MRGVGSANAAGLAREAGSQYGLTRTGTLAEAVVPTRHRHKESFSGAADFRAVTVLPCHIGRRQSESTDATPRAQTWISGHQRQNPF